MSARASAARLLFPPEARSGDIHSRLQTTRISVSRARLSRLPRSISAKRMGIPRFQRAVLLAIRLKD